MSIIENWGAKISEDHNFNAPRSHDKIEFWFDAKLFDRFFAKGDTLEKRIENSIKSIDKAMAIGKKRNSKDWVKGMNLSAPKS